MIREPIRKSPREFIIPITVEGATGTGVDSNPIAPETSSSSSSTRTNRFDRTKRYGYRYLLSLIIYYSCFYIGNLYILFVK